ncbi:MAG TPA: helix-turn-helix domain-containing protein [Methylosinus sp.]|uniref:helix-turn-helix domain-containing protein n=1 Tax=Methylosinus sp. TaxID=427 RepID=UPI002F932D33
MRAAISRCSIVARRRLASRRRSFFNGEGVRVSRQAATTMIDELSSNLRELTGRGRYRAWAVI